MVKILQIGEMNYFSALKLQNVLAEHHKSNLLSNEKSNFLILVEHNPVYTIGIRTKNYSIKDEEKLRNLGAEFFKTDRGGLITFHGPGQLVAYPIINLKCFNVSLRNYVGLIEKTVIDCCTNFGLVAKTSPHTGVWISDKKICAIGVHCSRYITTHGLAFNCNTDLDWFSHIIPCGIEGKEVTSLTKELGYNVSIKDVIPNFIRSFSKLFSCDSLLLSGEEVNKWRKLVSKDDSDKNILCNKVL